MKIHNCVRDAKLMELAELQAIDERIRAVHADTQPYEQELPAQKAEETIDAPQKSRAKKKKERVRPDESGVLPEA